LYRAGDCATKCRKTVAVSTVLLGLQMKGADRQVRHASKGSAVHKPPADLPVLIAGPTASGKSRLAMEIAARDGGVIVNADALQVHADWRILTARPSAAEEAAVPHRLYGHVRRDAAYSVGHWLREVAGILASGARPIIVGGTGLYLTALTTGLAVIPPVPPEVRAEADARRLAGDMPGMVTELDDATRAAIDTQNPARVQRAWEVWRSTGRGLAAWQADTPAPLISLARATALVLHPERDWLAARISDRFDAMIRAGALEEVRAVLAFWNPTQPWAQAIGAPELVAHLRGERSLPDAIVAAKIASNQYSKRQRTWFRNRMRDWHPVVLP
jgi:tRNA dimethylallyltransferase